MKLTDAQLDEFREAFDIFDRDGGGEDARIVRAFEGGEGLGEALERLEAAVLELEAEVGVVLLRPRDAVGAEVGLLRVDALALALLAVWQLRTP